jgi:hypothetical protein
MQGLTDDGPLVEVLVRPKYPGEFDDLDELIGRLRGVVPASVRVVRIEPTPQAGYGVTGDEILQLWVMAAGGAAAIRIGQIVVDEAVEWLRRRANADARATRIHLRGPNGDIIKSVRVRKRQASDESADDSHEDLLKLPPPTKGRHP